MARTPAKTPRKRAPRRKAATAKSATAKSATAKSAPAKSARAKAARAKAAPAKSARAKAAPARAAPAATARDAAVNAAAAATIAVSAAMTAATSAEEATASGAGGGAGGGDTTGGAAAGSGYSRSSKSANVIGAAGPLAVALAAMAVPDAQPVRAPPERPPAVKPAAAPNTQLSPVPRGNATPQCLARYAIGVPVHGADDVAARNVLVCHRGYAASLNVDTRDPDWVMERISASDLSGRATRSDAFGADPGLSPAGADATNADYLRSGYDRGHQAPAGDAKVSQQTMNESFFFTNMAPQIGPGFNRGIWKYLEETVRGWVLCGGHRELYVITGPIYGRNPSTIGANRVYVPREFYKIVYDPDSGRGVGFVMPNVRIGSRADLQLYVRPIADIEADTGLDFFSRFDQRRQAMLESDPGVAWSHNGACPGDGGD